MDDKIHIQFSRLSAVKMSAAIVFAFAVIALVLALLPLIPSSENQDRARVNALDDVYRALPTDPGERDKKFREIEKGSLELARRTDNTPIKASALTNAAIVMLRGYQEAYSAYKNAALVLESSWPSLTRVDSGVEYLKEAARMCVEWGDHTSCPWAKIQRNLDGAQGLLGRDAQGATEAEGERKASGHSSGGDKKDRNVSQQGGENVAPDVAAYESEVEGLGDKGTNAVTGSVRGALSEMPSDRDDDIDDDPSDGGGAESRPVRP